MLWVEIPFERPNLYFNVKPIRTGLNSFLDFICSEEMEDLLDALKKPTSSTSPPRTLIFFQSIADMSTTYELISSRLGDHIFFIDANATVSTSGDERIQKVYMFHAGTGSKTKTFILSHLNKSSSESPVRLILTTSALALGVNTRCVERAYHFLPPHTLEDYVQQSGRAGRDPELRSSSLPVTLFYTSTTAAGCGEDMRLYCHAKPGECRRRFIFERMSSAQSFTPQTLRPCCDMCSSSTT